MTTEATGNYRLYCHICDAASPQANSYYEAETLAGEAGWGMGLDDDAEAHFCCPECSGGLYDFTRLVGYRLPDGSIGKYLRRNEHELPLPDQETHRGNA